MTRMTAAEVAERIDEIGLTAPHRVEVVISELAAMVRDNLIPQWQDEPDHGGLHWVEFSPEERTGYRWGLPFSLWLEDGEWWCEDWEEFQMKLNGRRVCPIGGPPE